MGGIIYFSGFTEPRFLLTLSAVLNAMAMMMSFLLVFVLNKLRLPKVLQPSLWRVSIMLLAFVFFAVFVWVTLPGFVEAVREIIGG